MIQTPDIEEQIYYHFARGGGLAAQIRNYFHHNQYFEWLNDLRSFFNAKMDIEKIIAARHISEMLLSRHHMQYLVPLIDIVAELELKRLTNYHKQSDHTVHCLYLYLLGVTIFDNSKAIQDKYIKLHLAKSSLTEPKLRSGFSISWIICKSTA